VSETKFIFFRDNLRQQITIFHLTQYQEISMNYNELQCFKSNGLIFAYRIPKHNNWRLDMVRICVECKKNYGIKEPLWDKSTTHGLCDACYNLIMKMREEKVQLKLSEVNEET
jgi:hypothetical protein